MEHIDRTSHWNGILQSRTITRLESKVKKLEKRANIQGFTILLLVIAVVILLLNFC